MDSRLKKLYVYSADLIEVDNNKPQDFDLYEIGATIQNDGTVTVTGNDRKMKVLPQTGEKETIALSVLGGFLVLGSGVILRKRV